MCNISEYLSEYRKLMNKRCEIDARISFMEELIKGCIDDGVRDFELYLYDKNGDLMKKVGTLC